MCVPAQSQQFKRGYNLSINNNGEGSCADMRVSSSNGEVAKLTEAFTMTRGDAPILELSGNGRVQIRVRGWNRSEYSVEVCKVAVAGSRDAAEQMARGIAVGHAAGRLTYNGPNTEDGQWQAIFLVNAPRDARVDLETTNGPIEVRDLEGMVKLRASNGPVAVNNCGGMVEVDTQNGPISFVGNKGDVRLTAHNGPISVKLSGDMWNGAQFEARSHNGPMSVSIPESFRTGVKIESATNAPLSCASSICRNITEQLGSDHRTLRMNGASDIVRISTENGPLSIQGADSRRLF
jgi:hypothetical protein